MSKVRLFVGIPPDDQTAEAFRTFQAEAEVPNLHTRWTPMENIHLTLFFIGPVPTKQLEQVKRICSDAPSLAPFDLPFDRFHLILRKKKPTMIWGQYHLRLEFEQLVRYLQSELEPFQKRRSTFKELIPHCTLARIRPGAKGEEFHWTGEQIAPAWKATGFCLYQSQLHPKGARYQVLERYPLKGRQ